jgi:hypothetical protein
MELELRSIKLYYSSCTVAVAVSEVESAAASIALAVVAAFCSSFVVFTTGHMVGN